MEIAKVGVVGLGTMGAGIAQLCVEAGVDTVGREVSLELAEKAKARIAHFLARKVEKGQLEAGADAAAVARLTLTEEVADLAGCDLVIEAAFEDLAVKQQLFARLEKVVLNVGMGDASKNPKQLEAAVEELGLITGQRAVVTRAKKAIANFGLRAGMPVGATVTLRRARMWEFLDRFISLAIPRIRDFRGLPSRSFDGRGNYTFGIREQMIFPEIDFDKVEKIHGMDITIVTSTDRDDLAMGLLRELGWPFRGETPQKVA